MLDSTYEKWIVPSGATLERQFGGGNGVSAEDAFVISTPAHLFKLSEDVAKGITYSGMYFRLAKDIDMLGVEWRPIGYCVGPFEKREFCGIFDGDGHVVRNFVVSDGGNGGAGLFGYTEYAMIVNVGVGDFHMTVACAAGAVVGYAEVCLIANCHAQGRIVAHGYNVGGLVGVAGNCKISGCSAKVDVNLSDGNGAGGLCGYAYNNCTLESCRSFGSLHASSSSCVGGFAGTVRDSVISACRAVGVVGGVNCGNAGGFGGVLRNCKVVSCRSRGNVNCANESTYGFAGGFAGYANSVFERCQACGNVSKGGAKGSAGGFLGDFVKSDVRSCCALGDVAGEGHVGGFVGYLNALDQVDTIIDDCYATGEVRCEQADSRAGGFAGKIDCEGGDVYVSRCYAFGQVSEHARGFVGENIYGNLHGCFWHKDQDGCNQERTDRLDVPSLDTDAFGRGHAFASAGWKFGEADAVWYYDQNISPPRPHLRGVPAVIRQGGTERIAETSENFV